jgi:hypothetical protein
MKQLGKTVTWFINNSILRMTLNTAPFGWSCWYSNSVKDGVLSERGSQALCAKICSRAFLLEFCSHSLSTLVI